MVLLGRIPQRVKARRPECLELAPQPPEALEVHPVEPPRPVDADDDEAGIAEGPEVLARGWLRDPRPSGELADRQLLGQDQPEDGASAGVRKSGEHLVRHIDMLALPHIRSLAH